MSRLVGLLSATLWMAAGLFTAAAGADLPAVRLVTTTFVAPASAWTAYTTSTVHTQGVAAWGAPGPPEITALARTLSACRNPKGFYVPCSPDEYAKNVFDYVRNNIAIEYRFGLGKGGRGALIDQSGTPFDQAELMVKLLRAGGVTASYRMGTIKLTRPQFLNWMGLPNSSSIPSGKVICQMLADGGFPAAFTGGPSCSTVPLSVNDIVFGHIWVESNGKLYDPSFKRHTVTARVSLEQYAQCGDCASGVVGAAMSGVTRGTIAGAAYTQNVNETALTALLNGNALAMQAAIQAQDRFAELEGVIGGKKIDPTFDPTPGSTLPYTPVEQAMWTGDIPDAYRTTLRVRLGNVDQLFFADEIAGRRVRMQSATTLYIDSTLVAAAACVTCIADTAILDIGHPYAGGAMTYADEHAELSMIALNNGHVVAGAYPITIVHGWGSASSSTEQQIASLQEVDPLGAANTNTDFACGGTYDLIDTSFLCRNDAQPLLVAKFLAQGAAADRLVAGVAGVTIVRHHDVGVAYAAPYNAGSASFVSVQSALSVSAVSFAQADSIKRTAAYEASAAMWGMLEGAANQQIDDSPNTESTAALFSRFNRVGRRFINVPSANMAGVLAATATSYDGNPRLQAAANAGYDTIMLDLGQAELFYKTDTRAYTIYEAVKGGATGDVDPTRSILESTRQATQAAPRQKYLSVSTADGNLRLTPSPDLVTGQGDFPRSLAFQRSYSSDRGGAEAFDLNAVNSFNRATDMSTDNFSTSWRYSGPDTTSYARLGGGWNHSLNVTASYSNNGLKALGSDSALDASSAIVGVLTLNTLLTAPGFDQRLTSIFVAKWLSDRLSYNSVIVDKGGAAEAFQRLPDGSFNSSAGSPARLVQSGERSLVDNDYRPVTLAYTGKDGDVIQFDVGFLPIVPFVSSVTYTRGGPIFKANSWTFPDGVRLTFSYERKFLEPTKKHAQFVPPEAQAPAADILKSVSNNLGRTLTFTTQPVGFDGETTPFAYRITRVTDDAGRYVDYALDDCAGGAKLACDTMTVTGADHLAMTKYGYAADLASPNPSSPVKPTYRLRRWYSPSNLTAAYQLARYDELFRVATVTDIGERQIEYFPGSVVGTELWKRGAVAAATEALTTSIFDQKNNPTVTTDPLGRQTRQAYDQTGRLIRTEFPERNAEVNKYDIRGNVVSTCRIPKTRANDADKGCKISAGDIEVVTTYEGGPSTLVCDPQGIMNCNKPTNIIDGRGYSTQYTWGRPHGNLGSQNGPAPGQFTSYIYENSNPASIWLLTSKRESNEDSKYVDNNVVYSQTSSPDVIENYTYDYSAKYVLRTSSLGGVTSVPSASTYFYDSVGNLTTIDGPRTDVTDIRNYVWDANRRLTYQIEPRATSSGQLRRSTNRFDYDADGQLVRTRRGSISNTTVTFEAPTPAQLTTLDTNFTALQVVANTYDAVGNLVRVDTAPGTADASVTQSSYDGNDRLICVAARMNAAVYSSLPTDANAACTPTDPSPTFGPDRITRNKYDAAGQLETIERGVGTSLLQVYATYGYTLNGKQAYVTDASGPDLSALGAKGNRTSFEYDGFDRLSKQMFPVKTLNADASNPNDYESYLYDKSDNKITFRRRSGGEISYEYDAGDRLKKKSYSDGTAFFYSYNFSGKMRTAKPTSQANPIGITFYYDAYGRLSGEQDTSDGQVYKSLSFGYNLAGERESINGDGLPAQYVYDAAGRLTEVTGLYSLVTFEYDGMGRRAGVRRINGAVANYSYDAAGRLQTLSDYKAGVSLGATQSFKYNPVGQVVSFFQANPAFTWSGHPTSNKNSAANGLNQDAAIAALANGYDANGNLTSDGARAFTYDLEGHLKTVTGASNLSITYDPLGRIWTTTSGQTRTRFLYDGDKLVAEYNGDPSFSGYPLRQYVHGVGVDEPLVAYEGNGQTSLSLTGGYPTWLHQDRQGSVIATSDAAGVYTPYTYGPYGEPQAWAGSRFRYTGQIALPEAQLYHYKARVYDPMMGRFLQTDPIGYGDGLNWYAYVGNDPLNKTDPAGTDSLQLGFGVNVGPWRWGWGSYRVGKTPGAIFDPAHSSTGKYTSRGGGVGLGLGIEVQGQYCKNCTSPADVAGKSHTAQGDIGVGVSMSKPAVDVPDGFGGTFDKAVEGKNAYGASLGLSVGIVPLGKDKTEIVPATENGRVLPPPPKKPGFLEWLTQPIPEARPAT